MADVATSQSSPQNGGADPFVVAQPDGGMYVTWEMDVSGERVVRGVLVSAAGEMGTVRTVFTGDDTVHNLDAASFSNGDIVSFFARDDLDEGVPGISGDRFLGFKYINEDGTLGLSRRIASATELHHINLDSAHVTRVPGFGLAFAWTQLTPFVVGEGVQVRVYDTSGNLIVTDSIVAFGQDWVVEDILGYEQSNGQVAPSPLSTATMPRTSCAARTMTRTVTGWALNTTSPTMCRTHRCRRWTMAASVLPSRERRRAMPTSARSSSIRGRFS